MKKLWGIVSVVVTIVGLIDYTLKLFSAMEFLKEYIYMILGAMGASYLIISGIINYFKKQKELEEKQKELERQKQYEQDLLLRFDRFKNQYSGLFDVNNRSLQETRLSSYFTDKEINWLVKKGCVKIEIKHVL